MVASRVSSRLTLVVLLFLCAATFAEEQPPVVALPAAAPPKFVAIDQTVINVNALAGIGYATNTNGGYGTLTVTYLNGATLSYSVKLSADEWKTVQQRIVNAGSK